MPAERLIGQRKRRWSIESTGRAAVKESKSSNGRKVQEASPAVASLAEAIPAVARPAVARPAVAVPAVASPAVAVPAVVEEAALGQLGQGHNG